MPIPTSEPRILIKNLIKTNWTAGNVVGTTTPDFHTGWHNPSSLSVQGTFTGPTERAMGESGYAALGPTQVFIGTLFLDFWARRVSGNPNPKQMIYECALEARRIILANATSVSRLTYVSLIANDEVPPEMDKDPPVFRRSLTIGYNWRTA